jgi:hypothetical protein
MSGSCGKSSDASIRSGAVAACNQQSLRRHFCHRLREFAVYRATRSSCKHSVPNIANYRLNASMQSVEVRVPHAEVAARVDEIRKWLTMRNCQHTLTSTGSSSETVILATFVSDVDANEFARAFGGALVPT